jgi:hypothetical protein
MDDNLFKTTSAHLWDEPQRREQFKAIRKEADSSMGNSTNLLEFLRPAYPLGEICIDPAILSAKKVDSRYTLRVGLDTYTLKFGKNTIGRYSDNNIVLDDPYISRRHCFIIVHSTGRAELFDTASRNKTFVNDLAITRCWLRNGDIIKLSDTTLIVSLEKAF